MDMEIVLPPEVPVMTLPNVAFFPQALMPLHIFEPRYRQMLSDVLAGNRLFAVAGVNPQVADPDERLQPPYRVASVGIVRACQKRDNGTSDLLLQGLVRVEVLGVVAEKPYRSIAVRALASDPGAEAAANEKLRRELARLLQLKHKLGAHAPVDITTFLKTIEDPEVFADLAAFTFCENPAVKQKLLETLDVHRRLQLFARQLKGEIASLRLRRKLQGELADQDISNN
jgi:Lon protease-like protein